MTGNEKARIGEPEKPNTWEHWAIYRAFNPLDTTEANNARSEYQKLASDWSAAVETFAARIRRSSSSAWEGAAATASQNAIADYATRALELTPALNSLAQRVTTTVDGVDKTRTNVDEPQNRPDSIWNLDGHDFWFAEPGSRSMTAINKARDDARDAMQNYYVTNFVAADGQIPVLPHPESPTSPLTTWKPTGADTDTNGGNNGDSSNPGDTNSGQPNETTQPTTEDPATTDNPTDTDDSSDDATASTTEESESPGSTTPATTTDTTPAGVSPSGTPGSGSPGSGSPGGGSPGGGGAPSSPTPGGVTTGSPAAAKAPTGATAATAGGSTGRAGAPGMGGMGAGRGGGKSEDDETHQIPDWLKNMENTEELLGEMPRTVQGGVIGGQVDE
ncbi:WXG100 family type VII secretion target [Nocardia sp. NPDC058379]|uniref:WXG100 family type VII secretion target n=1 Tax=unclassified Nocardia TaxID=2637762 RepID=UPI00364CB48D